MKKYIRPKEESLVRITINRPGEPGASMLVIAESAESAAWEIKKIIAAQNKPMFAEGNRVTVLARENPIDEFTGKVTNGKSKSVSFYGWSVIEVLKTITKNLEV